MSLKNFCRKSLVKVSPVTTITRACRLLEQNNIGCLVVEEHGELCGIITDRDIALRVAGMQRNPRTTLVKQIMTPDPIRISIDEDLRQLISLMHVHHVRRLPIVNGFNRPLGIVTLDDLIPQLGGEMSEIGKAIAEEFSQGNA
jgi:CBS domain-containing protein